MWLTPKPLLSFFLKIENKKKIGFIQVSLRFLKLSGVSALGGGWVVKTQNLTLPSFGKPLREEEKYLQVVRTKQTPPTNTLRNDNPSMLVVLTHPPPNALTPLSFKNLKETCIKPIFFLFSIFKKKT